MYSPAKIIPLWLVAVVIVLIPLAFAPHEEADFLGSIVGFLMILLAVISYFLYKHEKNQQNRAIFLNFAISFAMTTTSFLYLFVGFAFMTGEMFARFYFYEFVLSCLVVVSFSFSIAYVVVDTLFSDFRTSAKYILTGFVVLSLSGYYYYPIFENPKSLYETADISDFKEVDAAIRSMEKEGIADPSISEIASRTKIHAWRDGEAVGFLFEEQEIQRIRYILPYTEGVNNYVLLLYKPVHMNVIYMNVFSIFMIFLFFGYQYKNDPPQGAYIEKILFLFLPFCSLEILHYFAYVTSTDYQSYLELFRIAQYLVIFNLLLLVVFFSLRLSFITSIKGEFYERELVLDSEHISRWRDGIDNLVVRHFLNPQTLHGRLFTPREAKSKT